MRLKGECGGRQRTESFGVGRKEENKENEVREGGKG
jgi:hypothetical protein